MRIGDRRARAVRPSDRRRPISRRPAARVDGERASDAATSSCCTPIRLLDPGPRQPPVCGQRLVPGSGGHVVGAAAAATAAGGTISTCSSRPATRRRCSRPLPTRRRASTTSRSPPIPSGSRLREGMRRRLAARAVRSGARARWSRFRSSRGSEIVRASRPAGGAHPRHPAGDRRAARLARIPAMAAHRCSTSDRSSTAATCRILSRAFASVAQRHPDVSLDIVGDNRSYPHQDIAALIARAADSTSDALAPLRRRPPAAPLYRDARAFAFLSDTKGSA